jgi:GxxExxY protein
MDTNESQLLLKDEVYAIVGTAMEVHNQHNAGFAEGVYQESMAIEFGLRGIPFEPQKRLKISYKGVVLHCEFVADFVCFGSVIVEIKAIRELANRDEAQVINYLRAPAFASGFYLTSAIPDDSTGTASSSDLHSCSFVAKHILSLP